MSTGRRLAVPQDCCNDAHCQAVAGRGGTRDRKNMWGGSQISGWRRFESDPCIWLAGPL